MNDSEEKIKETVEKGLLDQIIEALTKPSEVRSAVTSHKKPGDVVFKGTFEEVNNFFYEKGWTDGLPIVPPTEEEVEKFLKYTDRSPDEEIAILPQANLRATPRNIAVNAIMAGCSPKYMPLLIAAVEAIGEPDFQLMDLGTTACNIPWLLVNGPIIKQLGIQHGVGLASRGPNTVIGRGFQLIVRNIAGFRPGETYMGTWGYFPPFVFAEDEDACDEMGWNPYHVEHGFSRGISTVTARTTMNWGPQLLGAKGTDAEPILNQICEMQNRITLSSRSLLFGPRSMATLLIAPPTASVIARGGYSKREVAEYVWKNTTIPRRKAVTLKGRYRLPKEFDEMGPDEMIPLFATASPDVFDVVVCGDPWRDKAMNLWMIYNRPVTKEIKLPANWDKLQ
ncbi:hypothetical protein ACFLT4_03995 [Chloroflexota bacterium]